MEQRKVDHTYQDHANEVERNPHDSAMTSTGNGIVPSPDRNFPMKLHFLLNELHSDGLSHIISWQPHGRCFIVHKPDEFAKTVLPMWFRQSKFASFQRQLNLYGFKRLTSGRDKGGYYHEYFLRSKAFLTSRIPRTKLKNEGARKSTSPETEPNFYLLAYLPEETPHSSNRMHSLSTAIDTIASNSTHRTNQIESAPLSLSCLGSRNASLNQSQTTPGLSLVDQLSSLGIPNLSGGILSSLPTSTSSLSNNNLVSQLLLQQALLNGQQQQQQQQQQQALANQQALIANLPSVALLQQLGQNNNLSNAAATLIDAARLAHQQQISNAAATSTTGHSSQLTNLLLNRDLMALRYAVNGSIGTGLGNNNNSNISNNSSLDQVLRNIALVNAIGTNNGSNTNTNSSHNNGSLNVENRGTGTTSSMTNLQRFLSKSTNKAEDRQ